MNDNFTIVNKTKSTPARVLFANIKNAVLGAKYELSLVFVGKTKSRTLNKKYRGKDKPTNVLSFPLDKNTGEIFICPSVAKKDGFSVGFLFIHGALHLKGLDHGDTMEKLEEKFCKKFSIIQCPETSQLE